MIEYRGGDLLNSEAEALVNAVNCVGVMGRGIALQFTHAFPANFEAYAAACKRRPRGQRNAVEGCTRPLARHFAT